ERQRVLVGLARLGLVAGELQQVAEVVPHLGGGLPLGERALGGDGAVDGGRRHRGRGERGEGDGGDDGEDEEADLHRQLTHCSGSSRRGGSSLIVPGLDRPQLAPAVPTGLALSFTFPSSVTTRNCTASQPVLSRICAIWRCR